MDPIRAATGQLVEDDFFNNWIAEYPNKMVISLAFLTNDKFDKNHKLRQISTNPQVWIDSALKTPSISEVIPADCKVYKQVRTCHADLKTLFPKGFLKYLAYGLEHPQKGLSK